MRPPPPHAAHPDCNKLVTKLDNMSIDKEVPVTAIDTHYDKEKSELLLLLGDENGEIGVYDISVILNIPELEPFDITTYERRNPHRELKKRSREEKKQGKGTAAMESDSDLDES